MRRIRHGSHFSHSTPRILFVQTEASRYGTEAIKRLTADKFYPRASVLAVCREADSKDFESLENVAEVITYPPKAPLSSLTTLVRQIKDFDPDITCGVFSGRPVFRKQKAIFFLAGCRQRFVFNAQLDGYWLTPKTLPRIFRREPLLFGLGTAPKRSWIPSPSDNYPP